MKEPPYPALNTREFIAKWHGAVEKHLVTELADILPRLAAGPRASDLGAEHYAALAHHLAYALQVAGARAAVVTVGRPRQLARRLRVGRRREAAAQGAVARGRLH